MLQIILFFSLKSIILHDGVGSLGRRKKKKEEGQILKFLAIFL